LFVQAPQSKGEKPSVQTMVKMAKALGVSIEDLIK